MTLVIEAGVSRRPDGSLTRAMPFGTMPRLLLMWLTTRAVQTQSPVVELGDSLRAFVTDVGVSAANSRQRAQLLDQMRRLTALRYTLLTSTSTATTGYEHQATRQVIDDLEWFSRGDASSEDTLLTSQITLSDRFFTDFVLAHAIPLSTEHLRRLSRRGAKGLTLDVYTWLAYRTHALPGPRQVPWASLEAQFGGQYARSRDFRRDLRSALAEVMQVHDGFRVNVADAGVLLLPSTPPIAPRRRRLLSS